MQKNKKVAEAIENMILPDLPDAEVYWADGGQSAIVVVDDPHNPYFINVVPDLTTGGVRTCSTAGDGWGIGWEA